MPAVICMETNIKLITIIKLRVINSTCKNCIWIYSFYNSDTMDHKMAWRLAIAAAILLSCSNEGEGMPLNIEQLQYESRLLHRTEVTSHHESTNDGQILEISHRTSRQVSSHGAIIDSSEELQSLEPGPYNHNEPGHNHGILIDKTHQSIQEAPHRGLDRKVYDHSLPNHGIVIDDENEFEDNSVGEENRQQITDKGGRSMPREI